ncbi:MAG: lipase [Gammaproteobacteria bacterium]|jgi:pimeloyl-ACP methyl ester carboxylesterase|nr:lipase [Gammaproteobacteria bacterium]MBQ0773545.1 lipase [Gammaproteobacteria bacterium]
MDINTVLVAKRRIYTLKGALATLSLITLLPLSLQIAATETEDVLTFYTLPTSLPAGIPGEIFREEPMRAGPPSANKAADAFRVMYHSANALGNPNLTTGSIIIPKGSTSTLRNIVVMAPGTAGPAFRCTPSRMIDNGAYYEQSAINDMLSRGYIIAIPDYEGYHQNPQSTYIVGRSMGAAAIDIARATAHHFNANVSEYQVAFRGYSQGGAASLWAAQMQPTYAPEMTVVGTAAGGVPANLAQVALPLEGQPGFGVLFYALLGQDYAYPGLSLSPYLSDAGRAAVSSMENDMCVIELIQGFSGKKLSDLTDINPLNLDRFNRIAENELGKTEITSPIFQYHEIQDGLVAFGQAKDLRTTYCSQGATHTWKEYDTDGENGVIRHINLVYHGNADVIDFLENRFSGIPASSNCVE